jgi:hypothetical protein
MTKHILITAGLLLAGVPGHTSDTEAKMAFARLRTLAGEWQADSPMGKAHVSYQVIAGGSAIVERETMDGMPEMSMETVFHLDGSRLILTHYCMAGNQPRMVARSYSPTTGDLRFEFLDATNLATPNAGHMHNASLHFVDGQHFSSEWQFYENGQPKTTESFQFTRVR